MYIHACMRHINLYYEFILQSTEVIGLQSMHARRAKIAVINALGDDSL